MSFLDFFKKTDINQCVKEHRADPDSLLLDVRTPSEYRRGHVPGSRNIPLNTVDKASAELENKDMPIYVYCHSGGRSTQAMHILKRNGFTNVKDAGGITAYDGPLEY